MCTGLELAAVGALAAGAGTGVGLYNQHRTLENQDQQNAIGIRHQQAIQADANAATNQAVQHLTAGNNTDQGKAGLDQYLAQLRTTTPQNAQNFASPGVSSAYDSLAGADLKATDDRAGQQAGLLSRIDAPAVQRQNESAGVAGLSTLLQQYGSNSSAEAYLNQLRLAGIHDNPWLALTGDALKAGGTAAMSYGLSSAAAPAASAESTYAGHGFGYGSGFSGGAGGGF